MEFAAVLFTERSGHYARPSRLESRKSHGVPMDAIASGYLTGLAVCGFTRPAARQ